MQGIMRTITMVITSKILTTLAYVSLGSTVTVNAKAEGLSDL